MSTISTLRRLIGAGGCMLLTSTAGCAFQGINSLPLPGAAGRGPDARVYHVEIANVGTLEANSPVMISDVVVGSIAKMKVKDGHADVEISIRPEATVAANAVATIGQTSLLGSSHLALDPPSDQSPVGHLPVGATLSLNESSTYPSTEQTLAAVSALINSGGLSQIGDIIHNMNTALSGHEPQLRDLLGRLDRLVGTFDAQRSDVVEAMHAVDRLTDTFGAQKEVLVRALHTMPGALDILIRQQPTFTTALRELGVFADTATQVVGDTQSDLVANLRNLEPTLCSLANVGPDLDRGLAFLSSYPLTQDFIDRAVRGDYINLFATLDLTVNRLKGGMLLGTRWGKEGLTLVPAPGDPGYDAYYSNNPLGVGVAPPMIPNPTGLPDGVGPPPPRIPGTPPPTNGAIGGC
ncbi:mammalian cell entry protein [Mycobacterium sp. GA-1841]|uniref:MCE family protein n=1 Tax=Mycobacterium sp. GA-1841 TaxID=1834154 RepID=UPI00096DBC30|nr:MCE family protein [Mycobacterium sp. GA-1841]OMC31201.1 mammalian cell entry protein [Mycobacterium sp. GA-1841]